MACMHAVSILYGMGVSVRFFYFRPETEVLRLLCVHNFFYSVIIHLFTNIANALLKGLGQTALMFGLLAHDS